MSLICMRDQTNKMKTKQTESSKLQSYETTEHVSAAVAPMTRVFFIIIIIIFNLWLILQWHRYVPYVPS